MLYLFSLAAVLAGCSQPNARLEQLARQHDHQLASLQTSHFDLRVALPDSAPPSTRLRVYLEGDGRAWITATQASLDPTPRDLLLARLALADPRPSVYLARPCQFIQSPGCAPRYWTDARFSEAVLSSLGQALDQLKRRYGNHDFELIGYSGGGALVLLLAAHRNDIAQVQTLAGNLSPRQWAREQGLARLTQSLEPLDFAERLRELPQRHLVGDADRVVPASLLQRYAGRLGQPRCMQLAVLPDVEHGVGWPEAWQYWRDRPIACKSSAAAADEPTARSAADVLPSTAVPPPATAP
ncbi:alpha/beta fold hydrolase [Pseudomonas cavernicola]|uniref:alpha/beta fold hydrolase n=1 Tax=Pseudomonas cavernicola TaxID=2320866 RepID=UPI001EE5354C|nr:alpha/beta hydrolase [Pseudomonas cavernicola]